MRADLSRREMMRAVGATALLAPRVDRASVMGLRVKVPTRPRYAWKWAVAGSRPATWTRPVCGG